MSELLALRFCYRLAAAAGMAHNIDTGENTDAYLQVKMDVKQLPEDYSKSHAALAMSMARDLQLNPAWVIPISTEEYDLNMDED